MKNTIQDLILENIETNTALLDERSVRAIAQAAGAIIRSLKKGGKVILFGNGGSASDSQHIAAELVGRFQKERKALPAIALTTNTSIITAIANDYGYDTVFTRQIDALGRKGDIAIGISTSGSSPNVISAIKSARKSGLTTIALAGGSSGSKLAKSAALSIVVPVKKTARVQEAHALIGHIICELVESGIA